MTEIEAKGAKLVEALFGDHDSPATADADHKWRECRRCLAVDELEGQGMDTLKSYVAHLQRQARVLAKFKEVCAAQGHYHADTIAALEQEQQTT